MAETGSTECNTPREDAGPAGAADAFAYGHPIDAIVLAGTHQNPRRLIRGRNKGLLEIDEAPLVRHVVAALADARQIDRVYVVGPRDELEEALAGLDPVVCVPQEGKMIANSWAGVRAAERPYHALPEDQRNARPLLFVSCDLPLVVPAAVDDFVRRAAHTDREDAHSNALVVGVAEDAGLRPFYGDDRGPGIERPLVQVHEGLLRLANIYVARPRMLAHTEFLQTSFNLRKAKDWRNVLRLIISLFTQPGGWFAAWMTARLQLAAMLAGGGGSWYRRLRRGNTLEKIDRGVSAVLGGPVRVVVTPYGGLSLDVDDEADFDVLGRRYREWMEITRSTIPAEPGTATARKR